LDPVLIASQVQSLGDMTERIDPGSSRFMAIEDLSLLLEHLLADTMASIQEQNDPFDKDIFLCRLLRAKDPKVQCAQVCITAAGLVLQGIAGSKYWPLDVLV